MSKHSNDPLYSTPSFPTLRRWMIPAAMLAGASSASAESTANGTDDIDASSSIVAMSLGDGATCAVVQTGDVKCWGRNDTGLVGRGDAVPAGDDALPSSVGFIDVGGAAHAIQTNGSQAYALLTDGRVRAWGLGDHHDLGLPCSEELDDHEAPVTAGTAIDVDLGGVATALAVGEDFACALLDGGSVRCWGANDTGQLGYGHTERIGGDQAPASGDEVDLERTAIALVAGAEHACALLDDHTVRCWGSGALGQLGYGSTEAIGDDESPSTHAPVRLGGRAKELVAGAYHTCARLESGDIRCWGSGDFGQLGLGCESTIGDDEHPDAVPTVRLGDSAVALSAGLFHTCAILSSGDLRCWGEGHYGQLGYGSAESIGDDEHPDSVAPVDFGGHQVARIFGGPMASSTCAQLDDGAVRCFGRNDEGQLGYGKTSAQWQSTSTRPIHLPDLILVDDD